jgi:hypothetical protein
MESFAKVGKSILKGEILSPKGIRDSLKALSYASGLPFYNAYRDAMSVLNKTEIFTAEDLEEMFKDFFE